METSEYLLKLVLAGESGVGKSSLTLRYADNYFSDTFLATIGVDFKIKFLHIDSHSVKMQIWDTAGQERFRSISRAYFRGAHGVILCYDVTDRMSFDKIPTWLEDIRKITGAHTRLLLVGTKVDAPRREVSTLEGKAIADKYGLLFLETSSKTNIGVEEAFQQLATTIVRDLRQAQGAEWDRHTTKDTKPGLPTPEPLESQSSCCVIL
eukprot:TRINITY_DN2_c1_g1_i2.p1 TRINITY_DN2_c1_g1~~TRINITY_DN2_c1_g1_i2.p1  ORF type:complete len:208 (-),score=29.89 TRINITY_DN2_c1_g1_i2:47-670(-)